MSKQFLMLTSGQAASLSLINNELKKQSPTEDYVADLHAFSDIEIFMSNTKIDVKIAGKALSDYNLVYLRFEQKSNGLCEALKIYMKTLGIKYLSINNKIPATFGNKLIQYMVFASNSLQMPATYFRTSTSLINSIENVSQNISFPMIMKDVNGKKGQRNYLVHSSAEIIEILKKDNLKIDYIFQEFIPNSYDFRVLVLDQSYVGSVDKRTRQNENEHRNNAAKGATETFYDPETYERKDVLELAIKGAKATGVDVAGVDIIISDTDDTAYLIELNSSPGFTVGSLEEESLVKYLKKELES